MAQGAGGGCKINRFSVRSPGEKAFDLKKLTRRECPSHAKNSHSVNGPNIEQIEIA